MFHFIYILISQSPEETWAQRKAVAVTEKVWEPLKLDLIPDYLIHGTWAIWLSVSNSNTIIIIWWPQCMMSDAPPILDLLKIDLASCGWLTCSRLRDSFRLATAKGAFHLSERPDRSRLNEHFTFNQNYPARSVKSQKVCTREIVFQQKPLEKADFIC